MILTFENEDGKTKYTARVCHWTVADRETHEKMGFHQGWGQCADQLETLVANLWCGKVARNRPIPGPLNSLYKEGGHGTVLSGAKRCCN